MTHDVLDVVGVPPKRFLLLGRECTFEVLVAPEEVRAVRMLLVEQLEQTEGVQVCSVNACFPRIQRRDEHWVEGVRLVYHIKEGRFTLEGEDLHNGLYAVQRRVLARHRR
ncbi:MAG: hypothetical protein WD850_02920 [Candidatus Spechtbacterales bacterium]